MFNGWITYYYRRYSLVGKLGTYFICIVYLNHRCTESNYIYVWNVNTHVQIQLKSFLSDIPVVWKYNLDICSNHIFVFLLSETLNQEKRLLTAMETGIGKPRYSHFSNLLSYWYLTVFLYVLYIELFKLFKLFLQKLCIVVW